MWLEVSAQRGSGRSSVAGLSTATGWVLATAAMLVGGVTLFLFSTKLGILAGLGLPFAPVLVLAPAQALLAVVAAIPFDTLASMSDAGDLTATRLLGVAVLGGWMVHVLVLRKRVRLGTPGYLLLGYVAFAATSLYWATNGGATQEAVRSLVQLFLFYVMATNLLAEDVVLERALNVLIAAGVVLALFTITQFPAGGRETARATVSLGGGTFDQNFLAATLLAPGLAAAALGRGRGILGWIRPLAGVPIGVAILLTGSRGGGIAMFAGLLVLALARPRLGIRAAGAGALVLVGLLLVAPGGFTTKLVERYQSVGEDRLAGRLDIWKVGMAMIADRPLTGVGFGCFPAAFGRYLGNAEVDLRWALEHKLYDHHNIFLGTLAELGVVGAGLLFAGLAAHAVGAWRGFRRAVRRHDVQKANLVLATLSMVVGTLLAGFGANIIPTKATWLTLAAVQGALLGREVR